MQATALVLMSLLAVVLGGALARATGWPLPLVQMVFGAALHYVGLSTVVLQPEVFFLLFLPPLLFLDGWRIPNDALRRDARTIVRLALGLVVFTVLGMGLFIHWLIPAMPLAVAFAHGGGAVAHRPDRGVGHRRALADRAAPAARAAGRGAVQRRLGPDVPARGGGRHADRQLLDHRARWPVSPGWRWAGWSSALATTWAGGTRLTSLQLTAALGRGRRRPDPADAADARSVCTCWPSRRIASGILAAAASGVTMSANDIWRWNAATRLRRTAVWDIVQTAANGSIFVLLGSQIPALWAAAPHTAQGCVRCLPAKARHALAWA